MLSRVLSAFVVCSFAAVIAVAGDNGLDEVKKLQGTWQAVAIEANGEKSPADQVKELKIVVEGDEIFAVKSGAADPKNKFRVDASKRPKAIDVIPPSGPSKGKIHAGIYSLKKGVLTLCLNIFGQNPAQRPTAFKTQAGDGMGLVTLERVTAPLPAR